MKTPTQDKALKKYLISRLNKITNNSWGQLDEDVEKLALKILRHLNDLGYVQIPKLPNADQHFIKEFWGKQKEYLHETKAQ